MKKLFCLMLAALMLLPAALAGDAAARRTEEAFPVPTADPDETASPADDPGSLDIDLNGRQFSLPFDTDAEYSLAEDGLVRACFYLEEGEDTTYEIYLMFPTGVRSGSEVTPKSSAAAGGSDTGIALFISDGDTEITSFAAQNGSSPFPAGSDYAIRFTSVEEQGGATSFAGTVEATLVDIDSSYNPTSQIHIISGSFRFTMDLSAKAPEAAPEPGEFPVPEETPGPEEFPLPDVTPDPGMIPVPDAGSVPEAPLPTPPDRLVTPADAQKI